MTWLSVPGAASASESGICWQSKPQARLIKRKESNEDSEEVLEKTTTRAIITVISSTCLTRYYTRGRKKEAPIQAGSETYKVCGERLVASRR